MSSRLEKLACWSSIAGVAKTTRHLSRFRMVLELLQGITDCSYSEAKKIVFSRFIAKLGMLGPFLSEKSITYAIDRCAYD